LSKTVLGAAFSLITAADFFGVKWGSMGKRKSRVDIHPILGPVSEAKKISI
jgi:hypothetical protein